MSSPEPKPLLLAEPAAVIALATSNPTFGGYFRQALRDSGLKVNLAQARQASYRVTLAKGVVHYDLSFQSRLGNADASPTVADLIQPVLESPVESVIHSIWEASSFAELQAVLSSFRAVVRFSRGLRGELQGHVIMTSHMVLLLNLLAKGERLMSDGESMIEAVTRLLGLRAKVRMLLETTLPNTPVEDELTDAGLARTLVAKSWR